MIFSIKIIFFKIKNIIYYYIQKSKNSFASLKIS